MMKTSEQFDKNQLYTALLSRDKSFDGHYWVCVKTTGIYCKLSCSARKPLSQNVEFVSDIEAAKALGYRECKICRPNQNSQLHPLTVKLMEMSNRDPSKYWRNKDLKPLAIDEASARRAFKKDLGISFIEYTRQRRLSSAISHLQSGVKSIDAQIETGFESSSGFTSAIRKQFGKPPNALKGVKQLSAEWLETPIGPMICVVNDDGLHLLEFAERKGLAKELNVTNDKIAPICFQKHDYHEIVKAQLFEYFAGKRKAFELELKQWGTAFENGAWQNLQKIPYGTTLSYSGLAEKMGLKNSARAIARANGANKIAIIVPCHRVIGADGSLTGYAGKIWRKEWLLKHEEKFALEAQ